MVRAVVIIAMTFLSSLSIAEELTPEAIAKSYFVSLQASDWKRLTSFYTPEAQKKFREMMVSVFEVAPEDVLRETRKTLMGEDLASDQVAKLSDAQFFERVLAAVMGRALKAGAQFKRVEVVGSVAEKTGLVHVVTRFFVGVANSPDVEIEKMAVLSFEKGSQGWGLTLPGDFKGLASSVKARILAAQQKSQSKK